MGVQVLKRSQVTLGGEDNCEGAPDLAHVLLCHINKNKVFTVQNVSQFVVDHH